VKTPRIRSFTLVLALLVAVSALALAPRAADQPFFFIQLTDPQMGQAAANANFAQESASFEFAIATVNRLRPAFVIVTGDMVNKVDDEAQWAEYRRITEKLDRNIPLYNVVGNHDIADPPTPEALAAYTKRLGPDRYTFRHGSFTGIVINTPVIVATQKVPEAAAAQQQWLKTELERARREGARHIVVFQHHPFFLADPAEADQYFNVARALREPYLALLKEAGVTHVFAGHLHRNAVGKDGELEMVTTGPVGRPTGDTKSGLRVVTVTDKGIQHRYYDFGEIPNKVVLQ
jgi:3',5'-cyclic AMP phosphodiesterase CpdA